MKPNKADTNHPTSSLCSMCRPGSPHKEGCSICSSDCIHCWKEQRVKDWQMVFCICEVLKESYKLADAVDALDPFCECNDDYNMRKPNAPCDACKLRVSLAAYRSLQEEMLKNYPHLKS